MPDELKWFFGFLLGFLVGLWVFCDLGISFGQTKVFKCLDSHTLHECQIKYDAIK